MSQEYLYHYTTVESLAMILKSQSLKFSPLTTLDDLQEEIIDEKQNLSKYIYVSSWMDDSNESIPMWKMYSNMESGVRIKLPKNPFKKYTVRIVNGIEGGQFQSIIPEDETINRPYLLANRTGESVLVQVTYTDEPNLLIPKVIHNDEETGVLIKLGDIGKHKKLCWAFQKEWRYRLMFIPVSMKELHSNPDYAGDIAWDCTVIKNINLSFNNYFLKIDEVIFSQMEITLSPKITNGNEVIVQALKDKFNPTMTIVESSLKKDLR